MFFYKLKITLIRILGYEKPLRTAFLKLLTLKFKTFRPHYETILLESALEAKKIGYDEISVIELGVAGGNGIIALEKYKDKIQKLYNIKINIYGLDSGSGLPVPKKYDLPFYWKMNDFKNDPDVLKKKTKSKIIYGDVKDTVEDLIKCEPKNISSIFFDLDFYSSTKDFLDQISKIQKFLSPRVYCYFDDNFSVTHYINQHVGVELAINEFNDQNKEIKIGKSLDNISDFKFPIGSNHLYMMHCFEHIDYDKYIGKYSENDLRIK